LETRLDAVVGKVSSGYRDARAAGKLAASSLHLTTPEAFFNEWQWRVSNGIRVAQAKDRLFVSGEDWARILTNDFPADSTSAQLAS
jgi:glutamine cyclotransferase